MNIREATLADIPDLIEMGRRFHSSTDYRAILAEDVGQMSVTAANLINGATSVVWVAEGVGGDLLAMLGLIAYTHPISGERTVGEAFWWSEHAGAGLKLLERGKTWAREQGAVKMQMIQPVANEQVAKLYARQGFKSIEVAWQLDLEAA